jgi:hypothetical protein
MVPGVTNRWRRSKSGSRRTSVASTARSAQSPRGRGFVWRSTVTSCRSTSNSTSLDAEDRLSKTSQPQRWRKIRYTNRNHMADDHALSIATAITAGQDHNAAFWNLTEFRRSQGSTDRAFGEIPPEEIANAINQARREGRARDQDELYRTTRELLGDRRMTE